MTVLDTNTPCMDIEVLHNCVLINGDAVLKPYGCSTSQWMTMWGRLNLRPEDIDALKSTIEDLKLSVSETANVIAELEAENWRK